MRLSTTILISGVRPAAAALAIAGVLISTLRPVAAQAVGEPVPFAVNSANGIVIVGPSCDPDLTETLGGLTLLGSLSPSGPYVGVAQYARAPGWPPRIRGWVVEIDEALRDTDRARAVRQESLDMWRALSVRTDLP